MKEKKLTVSSLGHSLAPKFDDDTSIAKISKKLATPLDFFKPLMAFSGTSPAIIALNKGRRELFWKFIDTHNIDLSNIFLKDSLNQIISFASLAAKNNLYEFLREYHKRGLNLVCGNDNPLIHAISNYNFASVEVLDRAGVPWETLHNHTYSVSLISNNKYSSHSATELTSPVALGLSSTHNKICALAFSKIQKPISEKIWQTKIPNVLSSYPTETNISNQYFIPLSHLIPTLFHRPLSTIDSSRSFSYWRGLKNIGLFEEFKKSTHSHLVDWETDYNEQAPRSLIYKATTSSKERGVSIDSLKECLNILTEDKPLTQSNLASLSSERMKSLWDPVHPNHLTVLNTKKRFSSSSYYSKVAFGPNNNGFIPIFAALALDEKYQKKDFCKYGKKYQEFCDQFWTGMATVYTSIFVSTNDLLHEIILTNSFLSNEEIDSIVTFRPKELLSIFKYKKDKTPVFNYLDSFAKNADQETIKISIHKMLTNNNFINLDLNLKIHHPLSLIQCANVFSWAIERNHLSVDFFLQNVRGLSEKASKAQIPSHVFNNITEFITDIEVNSLKTNIISSSKKTVNTL